MGQWIGGCRGGLTFRNYTILKWCNFHGKNHFLRMWAFVVPSQAKPNNFEVASQVKIFSLWPLFGGTFLKTLFWLLIVSLKMAAIFHVLLFCVWAGYLTILVSLFSPVHSEQAAVFCRQTVWFHEGRKDRFFLLLFFCCHCFIKLDSVHMKCDWHVNKLTIT